MIIRHLYLLFSQCRLSLLSIYLVVFVGMGISLKIGLWQGSREGWFIFENLESVCVFLWYLIKKSVYHATDFLQLISLFSVIDRCLWRQTCCYKDQDSGAQGQQQWGNIQVSSFCFPQITSTWLSCIYWNQCLGTLWWCLQWRVLSLGGREFYFRRIWILQLSCMGVGTRCLSCWSWYSTHINTGHRRMSLVSMIACVISIGFSIFIRSLGLESLLAPIYLWRKWMSVSFISSLYF